MSLGLYVSSFYFFRSGKNSCYLGLNAPVQYNDTQYSQAIDFFEDFFAVRRTMETIESEKKLYYIETNPNWRGETDKFSYIAACIHSGNYGIESDIYDATSHERVGSIEKNQAGMVPFFVFVAIPKKETSTEPINKGLILFQSMGINIILYLSCLSIADLVVLFIGLALVPLSGTLPQSCIAVLHSIGSVTVYSLTFSIFLNCLIVIKRIARLLTI